MVPHMVYHMPWQSQARRLKAVFEFMKANQATYPVRVMGRLRNRRKRRLLGTTTQ